MGHRTRHQPIQLSDWAEAPSGRRVLIESADLAVGWAIERVLRRAGLEVALCAGPERLSGTRCSLVEEGRCPFVEGADVVVNELGVRSATARQVLAAVLEARPDLPVVVEVAQPEEADAPELLARCLVVPCPARARDLEGAVRDALTEEGS